MARVYASPLPVQVLSRAVMTMQTSCQIAIAERLLVLLLSNAVAHVRSASINPVCETHHPQDWDLKHNLADMISTMLNDMIESTLDEVFRADTSTGCVRAEIFTYIDERIETALPGHSGEDKGSHDVAPNDHLVHSEKTGDEVSLASTDIAEGVKSIVGGTSLRVEGARFQIIRVSLADQFLQCHEVSHKGISCPSQNNKHGTRLRDQVCTDVCALISDLDALLADVSLWLCPLHESHLPWKEPKKLLQLQNSFWATTRSIRDVRDWVSARQSHWAGAISTLSESCESRAAGRIELSSDTDGEQSLAAGDAHAGAMVFLARASYAFVQQGSLVVSTASTTVFGYLRNLIGDAMPDGHIHPNKLGAAFATVFCYLRNLIGDAMPDGHIHPNKLGALSATVFGYLRNFAEAMSNGHNHLHKLGAASATVFDYLCDTIGDALMPDGHNHPIKTQQSTANASDCDGLHSRRHYRHSMVRSEASAVC